MTTLIGLLEAVSRNLEWYWQPFRSKMSNSGQGRGNDIAPAHPLSNSSSHLSQPCNLRKSIPNNKGDALQLASGNVVNLMKARVHLVLKGYLAQNSEINILGLSLILFQIAADAKVPLVADNIKVVAFLLEAVEIDLISDCLVELINTKLMAPLDSMDSSINRLEAWGEEMENAVAASANVALQLKELGNDMTHAISDTTDSLHNFISGSNLTQHQSAPPHPHSHTLLW